MRIRTATLLAVLLSISCLSASMQFGPMWQSFMPSALGDARYAADLHFASVTNIEFGVHLPPGEHQGMTVTTWARITTGSGAPITNTQLCASFFYTPERIRSNNPSLAFCDAEGWPTNMMLTGTVTVDPFPFVPYDDLPVLVSNIWMQGVYTIEGSSSNAVAVSVGGTSLTLGPGYFNRNVIAGSGTGCSVTGTGWARLGVSRCPAAEYFSFDGGMFVGVAMNWASEVTNELKFIAFRLCLTETEHTGYVDMPDDSGSRFSVTNELAMPRRVRSLSSDGIYRVQLMGVLKQQRAFDIDFFDTRVRPWVLTDDELDRIRRNGIEEYNRRGIPRWK